VIAAPRARMNATGAVSFQCHAFTLAVIIV